MYLIMPNHSLNDATYIYGHRTLEAPHPVRSAKLSRVPLSQYHGRGLRGNPECRSFSYCAFFVFFFILKRPILLAPSLPNQDLIPLSILLLPIRNSKPSMNNYILAASAPLQCASNFLPCTTLDRLHSVKSKLHRCVTDRGDVLRIKLELVTQSRHSINLRLLDTGMVQAGFTRQRGAW